MNPEGTILLRASYFSSQDGRRAAMDEIADAINGSAAGRLLDMRNLHLAADEALTNAMEHGNRWNPEKKVHVKVILKDRQLSISIEDEGAGFDADAIRNNRIKKDSRRGRGIRLIQEFCTARWNDRGNHIELDFELESDEQKD